MQTRLNQSSRSADADLPKRPKVVGCAADGITNAPSLQAPHS